MIMTSRTLLAWLLLCLTAVTAGSERTDSAPPNTDAGAESAQDAATTDTTAAETFHGTVEVTARPISEGNSVDRHAVLVDSVTKQQIDDLNAQDLSAALRRVPGVVVSRYNPIGAFGGGDGGAVFIRGHGSSRPGSEIATMVDGIPRFVGIWTHPLLDTLSLDTVQQVQVYRSAQPVLLGNMAFGAVNMISDRHMTPGFGARLVGSVGSFDTLVGRVEAGGRGEVVDYLLSASHRSSDGHRDNADGEVEAATGRIGFRLAEAWDLSLQLHHSAGSVGDPGATDLPRPPVDQRYDTSSQFYLATLRHDHGDWQGSVKLYLDDGSADWLQWDSSAGESFTSATDTSNSGIRWRERFVPWSGGELIAGIDHDLYGGSFAERRPACDVNPSDLHFRNTAPYVMVSHSFKGRVTVTPSLGLRYNSSRFFGSDWGGQAGVRLEAGRHVVYANMARAFNLPGIYAAVSYAGWGGGDQWQNLEAESVQHLELGWLAALSPKLHLSASLFDDQVSDAIRFVPPPPPPPLYANVGDYTVRGVELTLQAEPSAALSLYLGGTWSDPDPGDVPNLPAVTAVAGIGFVTRHGWRANLDLQYVDEHTVLNPRFATAQSLVGSHTLVSGRVSMPLAWMDHDGELYVAGENLAGQAYELRPGYPMPGRSWAVGVDWRY